MHVLVARQAILDRQRQVYGYELLFRSNAVNNSFDGTEAEAATMQVLSSALMSIGAEKLLGGKKAFVNFDRRLLEANIHLTLPPESFVIEILETVVPTNCLLELCRRIQQQGYTLALDDFVDTPNFAPLANIANVIKVDMRLSSRQEQQSMLDTYKPRGVLMLAEKVETYSEFEWALHAGYDLFQGYFFARPEILKGPQIPAVSSVCLQLLREMRKTDLDFSRLRELIRKDTSLTYKLLRYVDSPLFARTAKIHSITRALAELGEENIRPWVALATLTTNKPTELMMLSLVRAGFCERLAQLARAGRPNDAFLMGMFSLLDALVDQPLDQALRSVQLDGEVAEALLGTGGDHDFLTCLYQLVSSYESGCWEKAERLSKQCGIPSAAIGQAYIDSTIWADHIIHSADI